MDLRPLPLQLLLEVGARPLQGSVRNAFPGLKERTEWFAYSWRGLGHVTFTYP